jgi:hypothetical protein
MQSLDPKPIPLQTGMVAQPKPQTASQVVREETLLRLLLQGFTVKEAAANMRASYQTMLKLARDPHFILRVREMSGEIAGRMVEEMSTNAVDFAKRLEEASEKALESMMAMMDEAPTGQLKYRIASDLLDRDSRSSKTRKVDVQATHKHDFINPDLLAHAAGVANELMVRASGTGTDTAVIDVEPTSSSGGEADPAAGGTGSGG